MLTKEDLLLIRGVVKEVVKEELHEGLLLFMEHQIMPHFEYMYSEFDKIHKELAWIKNQMVTKSFLEERLERFRLDLGLSYRSAR